MKTLWEWWSDEDPPMPKPKPKKQPNFYDMPGTPTAKPATEKFPHLLLGEPEVISLKKPAGMTIGGALVSLDAAVPQFCQPLMAGDANIPSVVYPGLTALKALTYVAEVVIEISKHNKKEVLLHPQVADRVRQVCENQIGSGKGPDPSVASVFKLIHPEPPAPTTSTSPAPPKLKPFNRKFS